MKKLSLLCAGFGLVLLGGCSSFSIASKGWTQVTVNGDTVTAQCNYDTNTVALDGKLIHLESAAKPIKVKNLSISCDVPSKTLIMEYNK